MADSVIIHKEKSHPGIAGRKPLPSTLVSRALAIVDKHIPEIFEALIKKAIDGDREAQIYLIDRRLGKPKQQTELLGAEKIGSGAMIAIFKAIAEERRRLYLPAEARQAGPGVTLIEGGRDAIQITGEAERSDEGEGQALQE